MSTETNKMCRKCGDRARIPTEKWCPMCRRLMLKEMQQSGYFDRIVPIHRREVRNSTDDFPDSAWVDLNFS